MYEVEISLKRVQSFIFEVPRLKVMLGANALIGQTIRHELTSLMNGRGCSLPWPEELKGTIKDDPLEGAGAEDGDDPERLFRNGVLARDGGHFIAVFPDEPVAQQFLSEAQAILSRRLPGVLYDAEITPFGDNEARESKNRGNPSEIHMLHLPVLQICQETGREPASYEWLTLDGEKRWISQSVHHRREWGDKFRDGKTRDIVGLMRDSLYPESMNWQRPEDIGDLTSGGYLALVHADGNKAGQRYKAWQDRNKNRVRIAREAYGELFFQSLRVAVRRSLVAALGATFTTPGGVRPYEVLMLGGDDLLLACRADRALNFALNYGRALQSHELADGKRLDVAIGVAITKKTYPLYRLYELAESLASSAKRRYRSLPDAEKQSVVDWQVVTQSWFDELESVRWKSERIEYAVDRTSETLLLSARPYNILCGYSLEHLLAAARALNDETDEAPRAARSALRSLRRACEKGRLSGEMAFERLPDHIRAAMGSRLWEKHNSVHITRALDIIGIYEISRLGSKET